MKAIAKIVLPAAHAKGRSAAEVRAQARLLLLLACVANRTGDHGRQWPHPRASCTGGHGTLP